MKSTKFKKTKVTTSPKTKLKPLEEAVRKNLMPVLKGHPVGTVCQISRITKIPESSVRFAIKTGNIPQYQLPGGDLVTDINAIIAHFQSTKTGRRPIRTEIVPVKSPALSRIGDALKKLVALATSDLR